MSWLEGKVALVPIDFSTESKEGLDTALEIIADPSRVHALHVAPDLVVMEPGVVWESTTDESRRKKLEAAFKKQFGDQKYEGVAFHVAFGDAGHEIVEFAENVGADLIVLPSHGRTGLRRLLIGSVAERVARLARCPVLILRN